MQGVYFRAHCADAARSRGLEGYVRNLPDGSVEAAFEGERVIIEECIDWNRTSQPAARVIAADIEWGPATGEFRGFEILR